MSSGYAFPQMFLFAPTVTARANAQAAKARRSGLDGLTGRPRPVLVLAGPLASALGI